MGYSLIYVTTKDAAEARHIARSLVDARLAAGVNCVVEMASVFRWQGEVRERAEAAFFAKTRSALVEQAVSLIRREHSYDCPAIVVLPVTGGNPAYLDWIDSETA
jgi:periplasmic divalent cation tolerance protein